jgi:elongation factor G
VLASAITTTLTTEQAMKSYAPDAIRNVALVGHGGAGKTSLAEATLFSAGAISRLGRVDDGSTTTDYDPDEVKRKMSVSAALAPAEWRDTKINLVDAPGYADFFGEVVQATRVVETALLVVDGLAGLQVGTDAAWRQANTMGLARMIFVNKLERENADFAKVFDQIRTRHGTGVVALTIPVGAESGFRGVVDVVSQKAIIDEKSDGEAVPAELADDLARYREMLIESAAEIDDDLLTKYLEGGDLSEEEIRTALRRGVAERRIVLVLAGSALQNRGMRSLLSALVDFAPSAA